jgi:TolB protein
MILLTDVIGNPRVYLVDVANDTSQLLPVPGTTYNIVIAPEGRRMMYSLTRGLGYGSETWIADLDGQNARRVLIDPTHITAFARWSPSGDKIAYIRMPDSNIPFTVGELWVMDGEGNNPVWLGEADAGHGYPPAWSLDGSQIAFVGRENKDDILADQQADKLVSNIYIADVNSGQIENVTGFSEALTENPVWSPDGDLVAFNTNAGGGMEVWVFDVRGGTLKQVSNGANARYPAWLPMLDAQASEK